MIDVAQVLKEIGLNEQKLPRLAFARGDWNTCYWNSWHNCFSKSNRYFNKNYAIRVPSNTYPWTRENGYVPVPHIPPHLRPEGDLSNYHILFEVKEWKQYPADPFLLKQISGWIFAILGEWELTNLERSIIAGLRSPNV